jgi:septum formation protein
MRLILASASPRRRELLSQLGVPFEVVPSQAEEWMDESASPQILTMQLAEAKAKDVLGRLPSDEPVIILSADTLVSYENPSGWNHLGKPVDAQGAAAILQTLSNRTHVVCTGVAVATRYEDGTVQIDAGAETTEVEFRSLTDAEIEAYIATGEPMDKAGAYAIQGGAGEFVQSIRGEFDNVVGLPMRLVREMLKGVL